MEEAMIRLRMSSHDAHYGGGLVDGAKMLELFGDVATELLIRHDGDEGLFLSYDNVQFTAPVYEGDYIEAVGKITETVITSPKDDNLPDSARDVLEEPVVVAKASGTCVVQKEKQRG